MNISRCITIGLATAAIAVIAALAFRHFHPAPFDASKGEREGKASALDTEVKQAAATPPRAYKTGPDTPQFVVLSFDGSKSVTFLNATLAFEEKMAAEGKPLHFTYFINAAYFLSPEDKDAYQPPHAPRGISLIGFSDSASDIPLRVQAFNAALELGNEIGSHTVGHFGGSKWSLDDWKREFASWNNILFAILPGSSAVSGTPFTLKRSDVAGFRAPELGVNADMYTALSDFGFRYDASGVGLAANWPFKDALGIWHIPLGSMRMGKDHKPVISMDYSIWMHQSNGRDRAKKGTPLWNAYFADTLGAYDDYFNSNYTGSRAPVIIADHFSLWNDGVYWEAMKAFAEEVCGKPNVRCVTFKELADYLDVSGTPEVVKH